MCFIIIIYPIRVLESINGAYERKTGLKKYYEMQNAA